MPSAALDLDRILPLAQTSRSERAASRPADTMAFADHLRDATAERTATIETVPAGDRADQRLDLRTAGERPAPLDSNEKTADLRETRSRADSAPARRSDEARQVEAGETRSRRDEAPGTRESGPRETKANETGAPNEIPADDTPVSATDEAAAAEAAQSAEVDAAPSAETNDTGAIDEAIALVDAALSEGDGTVESALAAAVIAAPVTPRTPDETDEDELALIDDGLDDGSSDDQEAADADMLLAAAFAAETVQSSSDLDPAAGIVADEPALDAVAASDLIAAQAPAVAVPVAADANAGEEAEPDAATALAAAPVKPRPQHRATAQAQPAEAPASEETPLEKGSEAARTAAPADKAVPAGEHALKVGAKLAEGEDGAVSLDSFFRQAQTVTGDTQPRAERPALGDPGAFARFFSAETAKVDASALRVDGTEGLAARLAAQPLTPASTTAPQTGTGSQAAGVALAAPEIAAEVVRQVQGGKTSFDIRLDPPELGRIAVRMEIDADGQTRTHMTVERSETMDALRQDQRALERALQQSGLKVESGSISLSLRSDGNSPNFAGRDGQPGQDGTRSGPMGTGTDQTNDNDETGAAPVRLGLRRLDVSI